MAGGRQRCRQTYILRMVANRTDNAGKPCRRERRGARRRGRTRPLSFSGVIDRTDTRQDDVDDPDERGDRPCQEITPTDAIFSTRSVISAGWRSSIALAMTTPGSEPTK